MKHPARPRSPLWMVVLSLACEEPMHPYRMQTLIKQRGKDQVANVAQRNSVYQTIDALRRAGLIAVRETTREERRPERTIYEATEEGRRTLKSWVRTGLSTLAREYPEFPAVLATLYGVESAEDFRSLLETRIQGLEPRLAELLRPAPNVPRLFLLDAEYGAAILRAELKWLHGLVADLQAARLTFPTVEELRALAALPGAPSDEAISRIVDEMRPASRTGIAAPSKRAGPPGRPRSAPARKPPAPRRRPR